MVGNPAIARAVRSETNAYWMTNMFVPALRPTTVTVSSLIDTRSPSAIPYLAANARSSTISPSAATVRPRTTRGGPPRPDAKSNPVM